MLKVPIHLSSWAIEAELWVRHHSMSSRK